MISKEKAIEVVSDITGFENYIPHYGNWELTPEELTKFAQHFHKQGLLDGAEKCADMGKERYLQANAVDCREALRQMADEVGK